MTEKTLAQLKTDAETNIPDNISGLVSPQDVREQFINTYDSVSHVDHTHTEFLATATYDPSNTGSVLSANTVLQRVFFTGTVAKGDPVYVSGVNGSTLAVSKSFATTASTMPATGIAVENQLGGTFGNIITQGVLIGVNTSGLTLNRPVYVGVTGGLTSTQTTQGQQIVGHCTLVNASGSVSVSIQPQRPEVYGHAVVVDSTVASFEFPLTPTTFVWPNQRTAGTDLHYDTSTGIFTFRVGGFFTSAANWTVYGSSSKEFYADAEISLDGGSTWTRGTNSLRKDAAVSTGRTAAYPFAGYFAAGVKLRFVTWASATGVTMQTNTISGSTCAASRLTTTFIPGTLVQDSV